MITDTDWRWIYRIMATLVLGLLITADIDGDSLAVCDNLIIHFHTIRKMAPAYPRRTLRLAAPI
jgi:hypothetical protein